MRSRVAHRVAALARRAVGRPAAILCAAVLLGMALPAHAFPAPKFSIAGGYVWPASPGSFTDRWNAGAAASAALSFRLDTRLAVSLEAGMYRLNFDTNTYESQLAGDFPGVQVTGNDVTVFPVTVGGEFSLTGWGNTRPYVAAGCGFYQVSVSDGSVTGTGAGAVEFPDLTDQAFGVRAGVGVRTLVTPSITLFADVTVHYAWVSPDPLALVPLRVGVRF